MATGDEVDIGAVRQGPVVPQLGAAPFPILVLSGDHSPAFEAVCDSLAEAVDAERAVIPGRGHTVPSTGEPYNERLEAFMSAADPG